MNIVPDTNVVIYLQKGLLADELPFGEYFISVITENVFVNTQVYGKRYAGNGLNCSNCHLSEGRKANAEPQRRDSELEQRGFEGSTSRSRSPMIEARMQERRWTCGSNDTSRTTGIEWPYKTYPGDKKWNTPFPKAPFPKAN